MNSFVTFWACMALMFFGLAVSGPHLPDAIADQQPTLIVFGIVSAVASALCIRSRDGSRRRPF